MKLPWKSKDRPPPPTREEVDAAIARLTRHADGIMETVTELREQRERG